MKKILRMLLLPIIISTAPGCENGAGEGGTSTLRGKIFVQDYNSSGQLQGEYYGQEERVYVIYGDADFYGNDTRTSFDGTYEFQFLRKGAYTVFAYSDCDTCPSGTQAVKLTAEITENHSTVELPDLVVKR